jgi:hypothetical protein
MGGSKSSGTQAPNPTIMAEQTMKAREATDPQAQALAFKLASGEGGMQDYTQLGYDVRSNVFGEEDQVKQALLQNLLQSYNSPYAIPDQMQTGVNQVRQNAQNKLQESMRNRANLGGGLYGGRSAQSEAQSVSDLNAGFAEQDYNQMNTNRQLQYQATLNALAQLYPQLGISSTPFESAVVSPETSYQGQLSTDINNAKMKEAARARQQQMYMDIAKMAVGGEKTAKPAGDSSGQISPEAFAAFLGM